LIRLYCIYVYALLLAKLKIEPRTFLQNDQSIGLSFVKCAFYLVIMRVCRRFLEFSFKATALATAAAVIINLAANVTITSAQQEQEEQQQLLTNEPTVSSMTQNRSTATTRLFESTADSFRLQLPEGWVVQDVNNTGFVLAAEVTQGYGILAQLCPADGQEDHQQGGITNVSGTSSSGSCQQQSQGEIIHIIRYPNLGARSGIAVSDIRGTIPDSVLAYEIQKLHEVGYRDINIVNSTEILIKVHYTTTEDVPAPQVTIPGRFVEITYSTASAPSEIRRGYLLLTATNATPPNLETITGYSIFYEGASGAPAAAQQTTPPPPDTIRVPAPVAQAFGSFELIPSEESEQDILAAIAAQQAASIEPNDQGEDDDAGEDEEE
jgi:hypothetical protein